MKRILVVDDDHALRRIVKDVLIEEGFEVGEASDGLAAVKIFKHRPPDAVLLDLNMPYMNGMEAMCEFKNIDPRVPVIILTAYGDIQTAVEAVKLGAYDFISKPPDFDKLMVSIRRAIEKKDLEVEMKRVNTVLELSLEHTFGKSGAMRAVIDQINQVAKTDFSVIVQGETGTGKSFVANTIHNMSNRAGKPFVRVDIGVIPETLVESELFGYRKGAFTGADKNRTGYFESASTGTIFIDELENMPAGVQIKLLGVIDEKKICPLGCTRPVDMDVRIISATNRDIRQSVRKKTFREDLFYRLGEFIISLPPLRERADDIGFFAQEFVTEACTELSKHVRGISDNAISALRRHSWPGNIRELKTMIRRAVLLTGGDTVRRETIENLLKGEDVGSRAGEAPFLPLKDALRDLEKRKIGEAMEKAEGNKTRAAELLKISYTSLLSKLKEYGIENGNGV